MLQRHAGAAGLPMASEEGVGEKMRYAALAVKRLGAAVFGFPPYAAKPMRRERVSRRGPSGAGERAARALTQERPEHYLASPFKAENPQRADAGQGRCQVADGRAALPRACMSGDDFNPS